MRILVVEDYAPIRNAVAESLREAGHAVDAADDGREGSHFSGKWENGGGALPL